jgi:hydrogenase maturation protein HypF
VGFRPFVWNLAGRHGLTGTVCNTSGAVVIEVEGSTTQLDAFAFDLTALAPPLSRILGVSSVNVPTRGDRAFAITESRAVAGEYQPISPDSATCDQCVAELFDPADRRHRYPFINCTGCGPRFTIIEDVPYDRPLTTMRHFAMCAACTAEYRDPSNRRFHAQPNACFDCGPHAWLSDARGVEQPGDAVEGAWTALRAGAILALKGLGGFQLAVLAADEAAVSRLRERKHRPDKPFALMVATAEAASSLVHIDAAERSLLESAARPIVLLRRRPGVTGVAPSIAPGLDELGVMLPATPLHHLVLATAGEPLVMTSGNVSDEPIAKDNAEAVARLGGIADTFLLHDREIHARYDDSVARITAGDARLLRRARGYCPMPLPVDVTGDAPAVVALGAHLKNTFTILRDGQAFVGPHIGDLDHPLSLAHQAEALATYRRLFRVSPTVVAADLHPGYASTAIAERSWEAGSTESRVQHHHAHIASVMAEHGLRGRLLGVAFDGTGHGEDGTVWGGELLVCDEAAFTRVGHLAPVRQPGGDRCAREGWRMVVAYLQAVGEEAADLPSWMEHEDGAPDPRSWRLVARLCRGSVGVPWTTSAGRLFDAVASVLGVAHSSSYEAAAAVRLEALARRAVGVPVAAIPIARHGTPLVLETATLVAELLERRRAGHDRELLAAVFHESLAVAVVAACGDLAELTGLRRVALSGGVFQNALLLSRCIELLGQHHLAAFANRSVPANDGGVSLGQALVAASRAGQPGSARQ